MQICWYLAAVVQVQLCKYFIEIGDTSRESTVWGEINALRFAMIAYGSRSPIGSTSHPFPAPSPRPSYPLSVHPSVLPVVRTR